MKVKNYRQVNNAFGAGSPHWNLAFPNGNLTAAEIIAYCPHWLKSVDVIDRFITNGGGSLVISGMINEFRVQPKADNIFVPNSACMMMQYAMRRAGFDNWTVGKHAEWGRAGEGDWDETSLSVSGFRTPRITHPKGQVHGRQNKETAPIEFSKLALHIRKHPSGPDALDLTRCVLYAVDHPEESWLFPTDFERLVKKLGGTQQVTSSHLDSEVFSRRHSGSLTLALTATSVATPCSQISAKPNSRLMARTRSTLGLEKSSTPPRKRSVAPDDDDVGSLSVGSKRRSGRLATKLAISLREEPSDLDSTPGTKDSDSFTISKKQKLSEDLSADGDFIQSDNESSDTDHTPNNDDDVSDDLFTPPPARVARPAAKKARTSIQKIAAKTATQQKLKPVQPLPFKIPSIPIDPALMEAARHFAAKQPTFVKPLVLSSNRLVVDRHSVHLYAKPGAADLWASALSSTRFGGPRRHPPFRELHRLTDPDPWDDSDWAENIRWAKEQYKVFGSNTWTEYDYHLELITEHRRENMWISEEAIRFGGRLK